MKTDRKSKHPNRNTTANPRPKDERTRGARRARRSHRPPTGNRPQPPRQPAAPAGDDTSDVRKFTVAQEVVFTALFTEHFPWAVSVATRFGVFDPELIAVEALRVAMVKYDSAEGGFRPFLNRVLFCGLAGAYRKEVKQRGLFVPFPEDFDPADETALAHLDRLEARDLLQAALPRLSPAQRQLLLWMYEDQLSLKEIAARL